MSNSKLPEGLEEEEAHEEKKKEMLLVPEKENFLGGFGEQLATFQAPPDSVSNSSRIEGNSVNEDRETLHKETKEAKNNGKEELEPFVGELVKLPLTEILRIEDSRSAGGLSHSGS